MDFGKSYSIHGQNTKRLHQIGYTKRSNNVLLNGNVSSDIFSDIFSVLINNLDELVTNYSLARFENLDVLYESKKDIVGMELLNIQRKIGNSKFKNEIRDFIKHTFEGIQQSIIQYSELINTLDKLDKCQEKSSILDDMDKLRAYLDSKKRNFDLFKVEPFKVIKATLKPEYSRYIELYGFPEGSIFDTDKLTTIKVDLGIISRDE